MQRLKLDSKTFLRNFCKAFDKNAKIWFLATVSKTGNKFYLRLKINGNLYKIEAKEHRGYNDNGITVRLNDWFKAKYPDMMLRNNTIVSLDDLIGKYELFEDGVLQRIVQALKTRFIDKYPINSENSFIATSCDPTKNISIATIACKTFEEFVVNIDLTFEASNY